MDTANFNNVKVRVYYSFTKHNIFSTKAIESFVVVWIVEETLSKTGNAFLRLEFQKRSHFHFVHKDNANGAGGSSGSLVLLLFTRFSWDCTEIFVYGSNEVYWSRPDVLGYSAHGPAWTFSDVAPGKGLMDCRGSPLQVTKVDRAIKGSSRLALQQLKEQKVIVCGWGKRSVSPL